MGLNALEIAAEREIRAQVNIEALFENRGDLPGRIELAELSCRYPPFLPNPLLWAPLIAVSSPLLAAAIKTHNDEIIGATLTIPIFWTFVNIHFEVARRYSSKSKVHTWKKSPHLAELKERLEGEGFTCDFSDSEGGPMKIYMDISSRYGEA